MLPNAMIKLWTQHSTTFSSHSNLVFLSFLLKKGSKKWKFPEIQKKIIHTVTTIILTLDWMY